MGDGGVKTRPRRLKTGIPPITKEDAEHWGITDTPLDMSAAIDELAESLSDIVCRKFKQDHSETVAVVAEVLSRAINASIITEDGKIIPAWDDVFGGGFPSGYSRVLFDVERLVLSEFTQYTRQDEIDRYIEFYEGLVRKLKKRRERAPKAEPWPPDA
jgi:hypothetical protein